MSFFFLFPVFLKLTIRILELKVLYTVLKTLLVTVITSFFLFLSSSFAFFVKAEL